MCSVLISSVFSSYDMRKHTGTTLSPRTRKRELLQASSLCHLRQLGVWNLVRLASAAFFSPLDHNENLGGNYLRTTCSVFISSVVSWYDMRKHAGTILSLRTRKQELLQASSLRNQRQLGLWTLIRLESAAFFPSLAREDHSPGCRMHASLSHLVIHRSCDLGSILPIMIRPSTKGGTAVLPMRGICRDIKPQFLLRAIWLHGDTSRWDRYQDLYTRTLDDTRRPHQQWISFASSYAI